MLVVIVTKLIVLLTKFLFWCEKMFGTMKTTYIIYTFTTNYLPLCVYTVYIHIALAIFITIAAILICIIIGMVGGIIYFKKQGKFDFPRRGTVRKPNDPSYHGSKSPPIDGESNNTQKNIENGLINDTRRTISTPVDGYGYGEDGTGLALGPDGTDRNRNRNSKINSLTAAANKDGAFPTVSQIIAMTTVSNVTPGGPAATSAVSSGASGNSDQNVNSNNSNNNDDDFNEFDDELKEEEYVTHGGP